MYEDAAGELLWKYIEELKHADAEAVNFIARTPIDPREVAALLPLAESVEAMLRAETAPAPPPADARAALTQAIQEASQSVPFWLAFKAPSAPGIPLWRWPTVALALLLLLLGGALAAWTVQRSRTCPSVAAPVPILAPIGQQPPDCAISPTGRPVIPSAPESAFGLPPAGNARTPRSPAAADPNQATRDERSCVKSASEPETPDSGSP
jgi:hypothetical protein